MRIIKELYDEKKYPFDDYADALTDDDMEKPKKKKGEQAGSWSLIFETVEDEMMENLDTSGKDIADVLNKNNPLRRLYWLWKQRRMNNIMLKVLDVINGLSEYPPKTIALLAVEQDGTCLRFIKNQTESVCLVAVKQNWQALRYVKNLTQNICDTAAKYHGDAPRSMIASLKVKSTRKKFLTKLFSFKP